MNIGKSFIIIIIIVFISICISSCKKYKQRNDTVRVIKEWTDKEIKFPKELACSSSGKDTVCIDLYSDSYKVLLYVDSTGCISCRLKLSEWKKIMNEADSLFSQKSLEFVFFFHPKKRDEKELQQILKSNGFRHPVFIDKENKIDKLNNFPSKSEYQCFLLDKDNKVAIVGNPSLNQDVWTLFKRIIIERETEN